MTRDFSHAPTQTSRFNVVVVGALMTAMVVLAGILSFSPLTAL
ncbi:MAG: hypothetical protein ACLQUZ_14855 [Rhizomicrobium sp.]